MLNETFYLDGVDAASVGICLQAPIEFREAVSIVKSNSIPGRNGDLIWETGSYKNRRGKAKCFCLRNDVEETIGDAGRFLMSKNGYRRLETSDDPNHYWMARVKNSPQIAMRLRMLAPFEIEFDCKPQRFLLSGENEVSFSANGSITNPYGFPSSPIIKINGLGAGILNIGTYRVNVLDLDEKGIIVDCEMMNAYNIDGNKNSSISTDDFPLIVDGANSVSFSGGIRSVEITPRWWEL